MEQEPWPIPGPGPRARAPQGEPGARVSAGEVLAASFRIFVRHLPVLILLAAAFHALPTYLAFRHLREMLEDTSESGLESFASTTQQAAIVTGWLLPLAFQAVATLAVFQALRGGSPNFARSVGKGIQRLPHAFGASFLVGLAMFLPLFLTFVSIGVAMATQLAIVYLGALLGIVQVLYFASRWFVAVQAAVVEGVSPPVALSRSNNLTRGVRWHVLAIVLVAYSLPEVIVRVADWIFLRSDPPSAALWYDVNVTFLFAHAGLDVLFAGFQAVTAAVTYHALRRAKEGVGLDELLAVFD